MKLGVSSYKTEAFAASNPGGVEQKANQRLKTASSQGFVPHGHGSPTDVVRLSADTGIRRSSPVIVYGREDAESQQPEQRDMDRSSGLAYAIGRRRYPTPFSVRRLMDSGNSLRLKL